MTVVRFIIDGTWFSSIPLIDTMQILLDRLLTVSSFFCSSSITTNPMPSPAAPSSPRDSSIDQQGINRESIGGLIMLDNTFLQYYLECSHIVSEVFLVFL